VADTSPARGRWAFRPVPPEPRTIVELIARGTLDSELAATIWLLVEAGVPFVVAGEGEGYRQDDPPRGVARFRAAGDDGEGAGRSVGDVRVVAPGDRARLARRRETPPSGRS
jgi:hypothetical protein